VQREAPAHEEGWPSDRRVRFRVGIRPRGRHCGSH
jgi:hypothetical protein